MWGGGCGVDEVREETHPYASALHLGWSVEGHQQVFLAAWVCSHGVEQEEE